MAIRAVQKNKAGKRTGSVCVCERERAGKRRGSISGYVERVEIILSLKEKVFIIHHKGTGDHLYTRLVTLLFK